MTDVYCRIARLIYQPIASGSYHITLEPQTFVSRERRLEGKAPLQTPGIPSGITVVGAFGDMSYVYGLLKTHLESKGFTVEDVLEPAPSMDVSGTTP